MKTQSQSYQYLPQLVVGIAVILFSTAGIAAIMGWRSTLTGSPGNMVALHDPAGPSATAVKLTSHAAQRRARAKARAYGKCAECGLIVSIGEISGNDDDFGIGTAGTVTDADRDGKPLNSATRYAIIVRMADGSSRVINHASPASWRPGERVMVIDGTKPSHR